MAIESENQGMVVLWKLGEECMSEAEWLAVSHAGGRGCMREEHSGFDNRLPEAIGRKTCLDWVREKWGTESIKCRQYRHYFKKFGLKGSRGIEQ